MKRLSSTKQKQQTESDVVPSLQDQINNYHNIRRFKLKRLEDESGVSGVGYVAEGVQFTDGTCIICWTSATRSIGIYHSSIEALAIHGHGGKTIIEWIDE